MLTCRSLRGAILTSGLLLSAAWAVQYLAGSHLAPPVTTGYLAFLLLLAAALLLGVTFLRSLLPGNARRLTNCEH